MKARGNVSGRLLTPTASDPRPSLANVRYPATLRCGVAAESGRSGVLRVDGHASAQTYPLRPYDAGTRFPRPFQK
jgi:hypothetical protein